MAIRWEEAGEAGDPAFLCSLENEGERLDALYRAYHDDVYRFCIRRVRDVDVDDAVHETMLKAAAKLPQYCHERQFWPWLAGIAKNVCYDFHRSEARIIRLHDRQRELGSAVTPFTAAAEADCPEEALRRRWNTRLVVEALLSLPETSRKMLYWQIYEGLSYDEIAEREQRSRDAVRTILTRARKAARRHLDAVGGSAAEWRVPAFFGAGVGVVRRLRARSRAWWLRETARGGSVVADGGPIGSVALTRAAEIVATAAVAVGMLFLPGGDGGPRSQAAAPTSTAADALAIQSASFPADDAASSAGRAGDDADASTPAPQSTSLPSSGDPLVLAVPGGVLPPGPERTGDGYERRGNHADNGFRYVVPLPTGPLEISNEGGFDCTSSSTHEVACNWLDRLPDP